MKRSISIITPSYNQGQYIEQTIDSVLNQNYLNLEYIIIDGGSTDDTIEVIKKYQHHLKFWVSEPDKGQSHAINKGFKHCTGDIVNWLNSDDYYEPDTFNRINTFFNEKDIDIVLGKSIIFTDGKAKKTITRGGNVYPSLARTIGDALIDQPSAFFSYAAFSAIYPINENLRYLMDRELWMRYLLKNGLNRVMKCEETFVNFRLHGKSKTGSELYGFEQERDSIFLTLAIHTKNEIFAQIIKHNTNARLLEIDWLPLKLDLSLIAVFNEYFMVLVSERYFKNRFEDMTSIMRSMELAYLSTESSALFKKLNTRTKMLPHPILKWIKGLKK